MQFGIHLTPPKLNVFPYALSSILNDEAAREKIVSIFTSDDDKGTKAINLQEKSQNSPFLLAAMDHRDFSPHDLFLMSNRKVVGAF